MPIDIDMFDDSWSEFEESGTAHHDYEIDRVLSKEELEEFFENTIYDNDNAYGVQIKIPYIDENGEERWISTQVLDASDLDYIYESMDALINSYGVSGTGCIVSYIGLS